MKKRLSKKALISVCTLIVVLLVLIIYCPKCKQETLIDVKDLQITVIKEPDA